MDEMQYKELSDAVNTRMQEVRTWLQQAISEARQESGLPVRARDGYSACRYLSRVLWRTEDLGHIQSVPNDVLFDMFVDSVVGAAQHRLEKRARSMERLG